MKLTRDGALWLVLFIGGVLGFLSGSFNLLTTAFPSLGPSAQAKIQFFSALVGFVGGYLRMSPASMSKDNEMATKDSSRTLGVMGGTGTGDGGINKLGIFLPWVLAIGLLSTPACASKNVTPENPAAARAITADAVVLRVNEFQAATIQLCGPAPACAPGTIDTNLARQIVQVSIELRAAAKDAVDGWKVTVQGVWARNRSRFASITNPTILAAFSALDLAIGAL